MRLLFLLAFLVVASAAAQPITLVPYGGPPGGSVDGLEAPTSGTIVLIQDGRLFTSADAGETWTPRLDAMRFVSLDAMPNDTLAARTTEGRIYVSADGADWRVHSSSDSRALHALITALGWFSIEGETVWRSTDDGATWAVAGVGVLGNERPAALTTTPSGQVMLTTRFRSYPSSGGRGGIYFWDGAAWQGQSVDASCADYLSISAPHFATDNLAIAYSWGVDFSILFDPPTYYEALVSTDGGATWACAPLGVTAVGVREGALLRVLGPGRDAAAQIEASRDGVEWSAVASLVEGAFDRLRVLSDGTLLAGSSRARSYEYGVNPGRGLYRVRPGLLPELSAPQQATAPVRALEARGGALFAVTSVGAWKATPTGWESIEARNLDPNSRDYSQLYDRATALAFAPWDSLYFLGEPEPVATKQGTPAGSALLAVGDSVLFSASFWGGPQRSVDRGRTWKLIPHTIGQFVEADGHILAAGDSLWYSGDLGATWQATWASDTLQVEAVAVAGAGESLRAYALVGSGWPKFRSAVLRSVGTPGPGMAWAFVPGSAAPERPDNDWSDFKLAVRDGMLFLSSAHTLWRSGDEGVTWEPTYSAVTFDPSYWYPPDAWSIPFVFDDAGYLIVADSSGGLLRSATPVGVDEDAVPRAAAALRISPHPAHGLVQITPGASSGRIEVFDLLGRRVALVADGAVPDAISWDASALPAGLYFVRLTTPARTETTPLVVVR